MNDGLRIYLVLLTFLPGICFASADLTATVAFENLNYLSNRDEHGINDQETFESDVKFIYDNKSHFKLNLHPRVKIDFLDPSRNRYIPNESYLLYYTNHFELSGGIKSPRWGLSNAYSPTDVLIRKDFEDNFYLPERLGEVTVEARYHPGSFGFLSDPTFQFLFFPIFQETPLPNSESRFTFDGSTGILPYSFINNQETLGYPKNLGGAFQFKSTIKPVDFAISYYHGPEKDPGYVLRIDNTGALRLRAFYYLIDMLGFEIQVPLGNFLFHFESAYKITSANDPKPHDVRFEDNNALPQSYFQFVPGVDYTFHQLFGSGALTLILEYLGEQSHESSLRNFRPFRNDLFFGARYEWMNSKETWLSLGTFKDLSNTESAILVDFSTKLVKELKLGLSALFVTQDADEDFSPLSYFDNNSFMLARLSYPFGHTF